MDELLVVALLFQGLLAGVARVWRCLKSVPHILSNYAYEARAGSAWSLYNARTKLTATSLIERSNAKTQHVKRPIQNEMNK